MLTIILHKGARKLAAFATLAGLALICNAGESLALQDNQDDRGNCSFSRQLEAPEARIQFQMQLKKAKEASTSRYGEVFTNTIRYTDSNGESVELDTFSFDCLTCHDGINAPGRDIRYKNLNQGRAMGMENVLGSHPIGMHYGSHAYANRELRSTAELDVNMVFVDGKVGCLSCHNPLNPKKRHLVMGNERSRLCYSCHTK